MWHLRGTWISNHTLQVHKIMMICTSLTYANLLSGSISGHRPLVSPIVRQRAPLFPIQQTVPSSTADSPPLPPPLKINKQPLLPPGASALEWINRYWTQLWAEAFESWEIRTEGQSLLGMWPVEERQRDEQTFCPGISFLLVCSWIFLKYKYIFSAYLLL